MPITKNIIKNKGSDLKNLSIKNPIKTKLRIVIPKLKSIAEYLPRFFNHSTQI